MMFFSKNKKNTDFFKLFNNDEALRALYKYFTEIRVDKEHLNEYIDFLKKSEELGFSYYIYLVDEKEDETILYAFSQFIIKEVTDSLLLDLTLLGRNTANAYIEDDIFSSDGYFLVSNDIFKDGSAEETVYNAVKTELYKDNRSEDKNPEFKLVRIK